VLLRRLAEAMARRVCAHRENAGDSLGIHEGWGDSEVVVVIIIIIIMFINILLLLLYNYYSYFIYLLFDVLFTNFFFIKLVKTVIDIFKHLNSYIRSRLVCVREV
jgi:hypothetical protein